MKRLILMVGLPRSGKSTAAQFVSREWHAPIVCPDAIRRALHGHEYLQIAEPWVWTIAKTMVRALFAAGHDDVIIDAWNGTKKRREEWKSDEWEREYIVVHTPLETLIERAGDNQRLVDTIHHKIKAFEHIEYQEGVDWYIDTDADDQDRLVRREGIEPSRP